MILPTKHLPPERCLMSVGAQIILQLDRPQTVSELWVRLSRSYSGGWAPSFEWFVLSLSWLYAVRAVSYTDQLLYRGDDR